MTETDNLFNKTLENLFPIFEKWMRKTRGYHTVGMTLISLKLWYEWLEEIKEGK